jgi:adenylylsulfate kinase
MYDDWDFSLDGRLRQAQRMAEKANKCKEQNIVAVCDFVCPTEYLREVFDADIVVWMNTINQSKFDDTNDLFEPPYNYTYAIANFEDNDY